MGWILYFFMKTFVFFLRMIDWGLKACIVGRGSRLTTSGKAKGTALDGQLFLFGAAPVLMRSPNTNHLGKKTDNRATGGMSSQRWLC